ncbi:MAG: PAC2 family protein [Promethearchaeota archaeon]
MALIKNIVFRNLEGEVFHEPVVAIGMPGIGLVGKAAVEYLVEKLGLEKVLEVYCQDLPGQTIVQEDGTLKLPAIQVYFKAFGGSAPDLFVLTGDAQPVNSRGIYELAEYLAGTFLGWTGSYGGFVSTGALVPEFLPEEVMVHVCGTHLDFVQQFLDLGPNKCQKMTSGFITGANGVFPTWMGVHHDIASACILADTIPILETDPRASKAIVEVLVDLLGYDIDFADLTRKVEEMEQQLSDANHQGVLGRPGGRGAPSSQSYFG